MFNSSIFDEFTRMQRQMDRMMRVMENQFNNDLWNIPQQGLLTGSNNNNVLGNKELQSQQQLTSGKEDDTRIGTTNTNNTNSSITPYTSNNLLSNMNISVPKVDIIEKSDKYIISADVAGFPKENLKIDYNTDTGILTLSGQHNESHEEKDKNNKWVKRERSSGSFTRSLRLPYDCKKEQQMNAKLENGVLHIDVPRDPALSQQQQQSQNTNKQIQIQ